MLSILIPTYNYDCYALVASLHQQCKMACIEFEIIVSDDCSTLPMPKLKEIEQLDNCTLIRQKSNLGRSKGRNFLASIAQYDTLLFLDSDCVPAKDDFIEIYIKNIGKIILGGRVYNRPQSPEHTLLPLYGKKEQNNDTLAISNLPFTSPNFMIPRAVFNDVKFDEECTQYGHEDTLFGIELQRKGYTYYRMNNPVIHLGIEDNLTFLHKTRLAIDSLLTIVQNKKYPEINNISPLLRLYDKLDKCRCTTPFAGIYKRYHQRLEQKLNTASPSLKLFALYKLCYLCYITKHK